MNVLEIVIIVFTLGLAVIGYKRGFVRKLAAMLSLVISIVLVSMFLPYVTEFLKNSTPVYDYIVKECREVMAENAAGMMLSGQGSASGGYENIGRSEIKSLMEQNGYDSSIVDSLSDEQLEQYKRQYIEEYLSGSGEQGQEPGRIEQMELIENLPVPEVLKELMLNYNNDDGYYSLGVSTFQDYIVHFIATVILNVISFIAAVILVQLLLRAAIGALDILSHIPLIGGLNRILGLLLGLLQALFFIWLFFLILSMASATEMGLQLLSMVQRSSLLSYLYDSNLFLQIVLQTAAMLL